MHYSGEIAEQRIGCFVISQSVMDVFNLFEKRNGFEFGVYWIEKDGYVVFREINGR